ncbi:MAG: DM13 domain-containing protein [Pseudomonadota bacterium]
MRLSTFWEVGIKRLIQIIVAVAIFAIAAFAWYAFSPLLFDNVVDETIEASATDAPLATGQFRDADSSHRGSGTATIFTGASGVPTLAFTEFEVTNGPDLEVWLVKLDDPQSSADVKASEWVSLGQLKGNIGDQSYAIPEDVNLAEYGSAVIWCEQFGVLFAVASLN